MKEFVEFIQFFTGVNTWIALAGAALFVFLALFKTTAQELVVNLRVPSRKAAGIVYVFMVLAALITLVTLLLAFLDARDAREKDKERVQIENYQKQLAQHQEQIAVCISTSEANIEFSQLFDTGAQGVRCPGGGCFLQSSSCNFRESWVSYSASGDYFVESYELVPGETHHGNIGGLTVFERASACLDKHPRPTSPT